MSRTKLYEMDGRPASRLELSLWHGRWDEMMAMALVSSPGFLRWREEILVVEVPILANGY